MEGQGRISNNDMLAYYEKDQPHILINTSENKGIPVSMMEAMSYVILVIATNVSGVKEIVAHGRNGFLLEAELEKTIRSIYKMSREKHYALRKNAMTI